MQTLKINSNSSRIFKIIALMAITVFTFLPGNAKAQMYCDSVYNVTFFNASADSLQITWQDTASGAKTLEWGPGCFHQGTGSTLISSSDTATLYVLPNVPYGITFHCHPTSLGIATPSVVHYVPTCSLPGDDLSNPMRIRQTYTPGGGVVKNYFSITAGVANCYTDQFSYAPYEDVVFEYIPHKYATTLDLNACGAVDSTGLIILDSNQVQVFRSDSGCFAGVQTGYRYARGAIVRDFQVDPDMRYYIVLEHNLDSNDICGIDTRAFNFELHENLSCAPTAKFEYTYNIDTVAATYAQVSADASNSIADSIVWDFGDGSPLGRGFTVTHRYYQYGTYHLRATAYHGCSSVDSMGTVVIQPWSTSEYESSLEIFPNPSSGMIHIVAPVNISASSELALYSADGKVVAHRTIDSMNQGDVLDWNLSDIAPGLYVLKMRGARLNITQKIILE